MAISISEVMLSGCPRHKSNRRLRVWFWRPKVCSINSYTRNAFVGSLPTCGFTWPRAAMAHHWFCLSKIGRNCLWWRRIRSLMNGSEEQARIPTASKMLELQIPASKIQSRRQIPYPISRLYDAHWEWGNRLSRKNSAGREKFPPHPTLSHGEREAGRPAGLSSLIHRLVLE